LRFRKQLNWWQYRAVKTVTRIVIVAAIACGIYFATIRRNQFYDLLDLFYDFIQAIAGGYLKK
jgi:hypothetical protein